jgi:hypothetical protein
MSAITDISLQFHSNVTEQYVFTSLVPEIRSAGQMEKDRSRGKRLAMLPIGTYIAGRTDQ